MDWNSIKVKKNHGQGGLCALFENVRETDYKVFLTGFWGSKNKLFEFKHFDRSGLGIEWKKQNKTDQKTCFVGVQYLCEPVPGW